MDRLTTKALPRCFGSERNRPFQQRDLSFSNDHKDEQRQRVKQFLLKHHRARTMRFFGLPGLTWAMERDLMVECGHSSHFIGVEYNWSILERSVPWMPGKKPTKFFHDLTAGEVTGYQTSNAKAIFMHLSSLLSIAGEDVSNSKATSARKQKSAKRRWRSTFFSNNAIWLDLTSTVTAVSTQKALRRAFLLCHFRTLHVPIAVTLTYGRECGVRGGLESRGLMVAACFESNTYRTYQPIDQWAYDTSGGGRMATFCGILTLRNPGQRVINRDKRIGG
jgi:hypothetical protein